MTSDVVSDEELIRTTQGAARCSGLLIAGLTALWSRSFPEENLTTVLACSERTLSELSLCLRPRADQWSTDVAEIAAAVGVEPARLEGFLRTAEVLERLALAHPADDAAGAQLMAARDRNEEE